jgi:uncharacterized protein
MTYTKYKIIDKDDYLYMENARGLLYTSNGTQVTTALTGTEEDFAEWTAMHASTKKRRKVRALRILFGHACNLSCGYCMQKDIGSPFERPKNKNTENLVEQIKTELDISSLMRVELWGGESFLYWKDIMPIMLATDSPDVEFYISTNGTPLLMKHVEFFKNLKGKVSIGISHDGPAQEKQRGPDILPKKQEIIRALEDTPNVGFSINTVLTKDNMDLFAINDYFKKFRDESGLNIRVVMQTVQNYDASNAENSAEWVFGGKDLLKFRDNLRMFLEACREQFETHGLNYTGDILPNSLFHFGYHSVLGIIKDYRQENFVGYTNCGASSEDILSVDINGDIRMCPHSGDEYVYGKMTDLDNITIKDLDLNRLETHCGTCPVQRMCKSTCPIEIPYDVFVGNCNIEKVYYWEKEKMALSMLTKSPVELEDWGLDAIPLEQ